MSPSVNYEIVIGLEVHAQLLTRSKLFCGDSAGYGDESNTNVSPITLAHPGTLPKMNAKAIEFAVKMGLACECSIERQNYFARKHYFYPDLPKGFQVSQHTAPICKGGSINIKIDSGQKKIRLNRIHLEEDAGKSMHDVYDEASVVDFNRAGVPLIEIVTEPDLRSGDEAYQFLTELRKLVRYLGICDGNMEEGSLRCDANVSVRARGAPEFGVKVEVKNLNSIRNVKKAIEQEAARLVSMVESGQEIRQQTRSFDADTGDTFPIREKEEADDYRYFAEPDLAPFRLSEKFIADIRNTLPALQAGRMEKYAHHFGLSQYDSANLTEEREFSDYFDSVMNALGGDPSRAKAAANWMLGPVKSWLNNNNDSITRFPLVPHQIASLVNLTEDGRLSFSTASGKLLGHLLSHPESDPETCAEELQLLQVRGADIVGPYVDEVISKFPEKVVEYQKGKKGLLSLFVGEVMKRTRGKADPVIVNELLIERLKNKT